MRDRLLRSVRRSVAVLAAGTLVGMVLALPAAADDPVFTVSDQRISAPTGIATDTATSSYWLVSRNGGQVYALSRTGQVKGIVTYRADPSEVEAAAYRSGRLYIGDIGDPDTNRQFVSVYLFPNLTEDAGTVTYQRWDLAYPDGKHDAQAMVVDGDGRLYLITRGADAGVYAAPPTPSRDGVNQLKRVGDAPSGVSDAVGVSDSRWALRSETTITMIDADSYQTVSEAKLPLTSGGVLGLALGGTGATQLIAASSGSSPEVYAVDAPSAAATTKAPKPSASSSPTSTAGAAVNEPAQDSASDSSRRGTIVAVVLAGLVAVVAGAVAFLVPARRRGDVVPVKPAPPARASSRPPAERPVGAQSPTTPTTPTTPAPSPERAPAPVWPQTQSYDGAARASVEPDRHRPPGDIEDDDPFDDTTLRAGHGPKRGIEPDAPVADPTEPPRRSLGYDPDLWGEETLRRRPGTDTEPPR